MSGTDTAKLLRKDLKMLFPKTKFSVRTGGGSMSTAINVGWNDGASQERVKKVLDKHSKIDYDRASGEILGGGNTFIFGNRKVSDKWQNKIQKRVEKKWGNSVHNEDHWARQRRLQDEVWKKLNSTNFN